MTKKITIAIDAMGGDNAPFKTIKGVYLFLKNNVSNSDFQLNLYGDQIKLKEELSKYKISKENFKIIYEKNSNRWISKISEFVNKNKEDIRIKEIILNHFKYYFEEIICKYDSKSLYLSGSVAYYFKNEISYVSDLYKIKIVKVLKDPINHLVDFHVE